MRWTKGLPFLLFTGFPFLHGAAFGAVVDRMTSSQILWMGHRAEVRMSSSANSSLRRFSFTSTQTSAATRTIEESPAYWRLESGNSFWDGLFALAQKELEENRPVDRLMRDSSYNFGRGVDCDCYATGEAWPFVWTRDTSYSTDLALALYSPLVAKNSMMFRLSRSRVDMRPVADTLQITQDTGSGGSWPISTDRVIWALGARELDRSLSGGAASRSTRAQFRRDAYPALKNTIEMDRKAIFDKSDGLYRGEQSFLDWREQSYPRWTARQTAHLAMSKTLSTNVAHYIAIQLAVEWAREAGDYTSAERYNSWLLALGPTINRAFWIPSLGLYSSMKVTELAGIAAQKFDLLGSSLAILSGLAGPGKTQLILNRYPHVAAGAPVIWPQLQDVPIYHNRAIWPFVTSYWLLAARAGDNQAVFDKAFRTLMRGAGLAVSNMENFEFLTHAPRVEDGVLSGPVVNSRRQLWSVAGFIAATVKGLLGLEIQDGAMRFAPYVPHSIFQDFVGANRRIVLRGMQILEREIDLEIVFGASPPENRNEDSGRWVVSSLQVDGVERAARSWLLAESLPARSSWRINMRWDPAGRVDNGMTQVPVRNPSRLTSGEARAIWAPKESAVQNVAVDGGSVVVTYAASSEVNVAYNVYRNNRMVSSRNAATTFVDTTVRSDFSDAPYCYTIEVVYLDTGLRSHISEPACLWRSTELLDMFVESQQVRSISGTVNVLREHGYVHFANWGKVNDVIESDAFSQPTVSRIGVQLWYGNAHGPNETGITASAKLVELVRVSDGAVIDSTSVVMPHRDRWSSWGLSSIARLEWDSSQPVGQVKIRIRDLMNMSYFQFFAMYTANAGGVNGPLNTANIRGIRILEGIPSNTIPR
jgi:hypothetical protein